MVPAISLLSMNMGKSNRVRYTLQPDGYINEHGCCPIHRTVKGRTLNFAYYSLGSNAYQGSVYSRNEI